MTAIEFSSVADLRTFMQTLPAATDGVRYGGAIDDQKIKRVAEVIGRPLIVTYAAEPETDFLDAAE